MPLTDEEIDQTARQLLAQHGLRAALLLLNSLAAFEANLRHLQSAYS